MQNLVEKELPLYNHNSLQSPVGLQTCPFLNFHTVFVPFQAPGANVINGERFGSDLNIPDSQLEARNNFLDSRLRYSKLHVMPMILSTWYIYALMLPFSVF
jgi:hypothetical protein